MSHVHYASQAKGLLPNGKNKIGQKGSKVKLNAAYESQRMRITINS